MAEGLELIDVRKAYRDRAVLKSLSFTVSTGEVFALLGPSGSGKSTALNLIAGLELADGGRICISGQDLSKGSNQVAPHRRDIGMVFQDQMLWPHLTVRQHLEFVLRARGIARDDWTGRCGAQLEAVCLTGKDDAWPRTLSGGERQRLSIARALVARPAVLLLDEPCSNLDTPIREEILKLLRRLCKSGSCATVYVTHDAREAFELADRVGVLEDGELCQLGTPAEVARCPATPLVARLLGGGSLVQGTVEGTGRIRTAFGMMSPDDQFQGDDGKPVTLFVRSGDLRQDPDGALKGIVREAYLHDDAWILVLEAEGASLRLRADARVDAGSPLHLSQVNAPTVFLLKSD